MNLNNSQQQTLRSLIDRIIPADEWPSASENGVLAYLDRQFDSDLALALPLYRMGLSALDAESIVESGCPFAELNADAKDALLSRIERGETSGLWPISASRFFAMVVDHTAEGYYGDPEHNVGNPNKASWAMIGFAERTGLGRL